jgi:hypothetical protein
MEHSLPSLESVRPWRTATLIASAIAALELVLLLVLAVVLLGRPVAERLDRVGEQAAAPAAAPAVGPKAPAVPAEERAPLPRGETSVLVLNGNGRSGAASRLGETVKSRGYIVASVGNAARSDYPRTLVMYRPGHEAEARRLRKDLGAGVVAPLDGLRSGELIGAHVAVVLGR